MLTKHKHLVRVPAEFVARIFLRLGFTPNGITLLSLVFCFLTCLLFIFQRNAVVFGVLILSCGLFDMIDGTLARMTGQVTKFGSYLDAMSDRIFESATALTVAYVSGYWMLCFILAVGSILISYAKARAAMEVPVSNTEWLDLMERTERSIIFILGVILWGMFPGKFFGHDILFWTICVLNIGVYYTVVQRVLRARKLILERQ